MQILKVVEANFWKAVFLVIVIMIQGRREQVNEEETGESTLWLFWFIANQIYTNHNLAPFGEGHINVRLFGCFSDTGIILF